MHYTLVQHCQTIDYKRFNRVKQISSKTVSMLVGDLRIPKDGRKVYSRDIDGELYHSATIYPGFNANNPAHTPSVPARPKTVRGRTID